MVTVSRQRRAKAAGEWAPFISKIRRSRISHSQLYRLLPRGKVLFNFKHNRLCLLKAQQIEILLNKHLNPLRY